MYNVKNAFYFIGFILFANCIGCSKSDSSGQIMEMQSMQVPDSSEGIELAGEFVTVAHPTSGTATVNGEQTLLKLNNFKTDAGPVLEFYLATDVKATDYISLGVLKGLEGNYTYDLPSNINLSTHKYLIVWCVDFKVDFGHAILE